MFQVLRITFITIINKSIEFWIIDKHTFVPLFVIDTICPDFFKCIVCNLFFCRCIYININNYFYLFNLSIESVFLISFFTSWNKGRPCNAYPSIDSLLDLFHLAKHILTSYIYVSSYLWTFLFCSHAIICLEIITSSGQFLALYKSVVMLKSTPTLNDILPVLLWIRFNFKVNRFIVCKYLNRLLFLFWEYLIDIDNCT